ncbi:unnamed protein product [Boreogadus saida]
MNGSGPRVKHRHRWRRRTGDGGVVTEECGGRRSLPTSGRESLISSRKRPQDSRLTVQSSPGDRCDSPLYSLWGRRRARRVGGGQVRRTVLWRAGGREAGGRKGSDEAGAWSFGKGGGRGEDKWGAARLRAPSGAEDKQSVCGGYATVREQAVCGGGQGSGGGWVEAGRVEAGPGEWVEAGELRVEATWVEARWCWRTDECEAGWVRPEEWEARWVEADEWIRQDGWVEGQVGGGSQVSGWRPGPGSCTVYPYLLLNDLSLFCATLDCSLMTCLCTV